MGSGIYHKFTSCAEEQEGYPKKKSVSSLDQDSIKCDANELKIMRNENESLVFQHGSNRSSKGERRVWTYNEGGGSGFRNLKEMSQT